MPHRGIASFRTCASRPAGGGPQRARARPAALLSMLMAAPLGVRTHETPLSLLSPSGIPCRPLPLCIPCHLAFLADAPLALPCRAHGGVTATINAFLERAVTPTFCERRQGPPPPLPLVAPRVAFSTPGPRLRPGGPTNSRLCPAASPPAHQPLPVPHHHLPNAGVRAGPRPPHTHPPDLPTYHSRTWQAHARPVGAPAPCARRAPAPRAARSRFVRDPASEGSGRPDCKATARPSRIRHHGAPARARRWRRPLPSLAREARARARRCLHAGLCASAFPTTSRPRCPCSQYLAIVAHP